MILSSQPPSVIPTTLDISHPRYLTYSLGLSRTISSRTAYLLVVLALDHRTMSLAASPSTICPSLRQLSRLAVILPLQLRLVHIIITRVINRTSRIRSTGDKKLTSVVTSQNRLASACQDNITSGHILSYCHYFIVVPGRRTPRRPSLSRRLPLFCC